MPDLYLVRLHSDKCPHRKKGQKFLNCKCSLGVDGTLKGKRYRRSLNTRSLDKAYRKLAAIERPDYREPKSIQDAIEAFKSSKEDVMARNGITAGRSTIFFESLNRLVSQSSMKWKSRRSTCFA